MRVRTEEIAALVGELFVDVLNFQVLDYNSRILIHTLPPDLRTLSSNPKMIRTFGTM
jgi:hypothetical protein